MTTYYDDMSESAALNYLAGTTDFGDAAAIRLIAAYIDAATGDGSPEGAVTGGVGDLYTDSTNGHLYIKASGTGNTGWVQLESATSGSGDVNGPGSATDNALVRFDGAGGKTVQNSGITVDDSGNITSDLTVSKATPAFKVSSSSGACNVYFDRPASSNGNIQFRTGTSLRWLWQINSTPESGGNVGSDLTIQRHTDAGAWIDDTLTIKRSTGKVTLGAVGATAGLELGASGPRVMSGTGSPESVVTAPVGSTWTDTAATTGAIKWVKASGTGNTGWVVEYGDTGLRNLSAETLSNGWTTASLWIQRVGQLVYISGYISGAAASSDTFYTFPTGFRPQKGHVVAQAVGTGSTDQRTLEIGTNGVATFYTRSTGNHQVAASFVTAQAWPTSLPGT